MKKKPFSICHILKRNKMEWLFLVILIIAILPIIYMFLSRENQSATTAGKQVELSMSGFTPSKIELKSGESVSIELVNLDNSMHSDGGGWHQFASDELNFNYKISPETKKTITLKVDKKGEYLIYCDICCGGKENPSMQGKIIVY